MKRPLRPDETKLWAVVASHIQLAPGRTAPKLENVFKSHPPAPIVKTHIEAQTGEPARRSKPTASPSLEGIEPQRRRRIARGRDSIEARLDLHGLTQDHARQALTLFLLNAQAEGLRAVLVITGKGLGGDGVLRRRTPEWLADPKLRRIVAGLSTAERRHGGEGAFYIALKRLSA